MSVKFKINTSTRNLSSSTKKIDMRNYEDLKVWERAHKLCLAVYKLTNSFPNEEKFGLISQLRRASSSVPTNIAEGCGYETAKEFARFLKIASGSITEVSYLLKLSKDLNLISKENYTSVYEEATIIRRMLYKLGMSQIK